MSYFKYCYPQIITPAPSMALFQNNCFNIGKVVRLFRAKKPDMNCGRPTRRSTREICWKIVGFRFGEIDAYLIYYVLSGLEPRS